jgi:hypothetical protein
MMAGACPVMKEKPIFRVFFTPDKIYYPGFSIMGNSTKAC